MKYDKSKYKAIIFDFDGVILDSERYKLEAYPNLFTNYPERMDEIKKYIKGAAGINRYTKFKEIYKTLGKEYTDEAGKELSEKYDEMTIPALKELPLLAGVKAFLESSTAYLAVASSTPIDVLKDIMKSKEIDGYFNNVYGYPVSKVEAIRKVKSELGIASSEILFFGDAMADYDAAKTEGTSFIGVNSLIEFPAGTLEVKGFSELI